jgi:hypothetical protein
MKEKRKNILVRGPEKEIPVRKPGKLNRVLGHFGKLVLDVTKLIFGSLVLGTIIRGDLPQATMIKVGIIASAIGVVAGLTLVAINEE